MQTLYLWTHQFNEKEGLSIRLDRDNKIIDELKIRTLEEIKALQKHCKTILVDDASHHHLVEVALPLLNEKKARTAIPYALEDELSQPIDQLHFAFKRSYDQENHYLVSATDKVRLAHCLKTFSDLSLTVDAMTIDLLALRPNECCLFENKVLINTPDLKSALPMDILGVLPQQNLPPCYAFVDSSPTEVSLTFEPINEPSHQWIARRLNQAPLFEICQGEYQLGPKKNTLKRSGVFFAGLTTAWVVVFITSHLYQIHSIHQKQALIDQDIAKIYRTFFPDAKRVINPRFRVEQRLKESNRASNTFWHLLSNLSQAKQNKSIELEQLTFQNQTLSLSVSASSFSELESMVNQLKAQHLTVRQTQASRKDNRVMAQWEIK